MLGARRAPGTAAAGLRSSLQTVRTLFAPGGADVLPGLRVAPSRRKCREHAWIEQLRPTILLHRGMPPRQGDRTTRAFR
jgi:hypothetical protein